MITVAAVLAILALLCFAFARSCNGGGPENGVLGLFAFLAGLFFTLAALCAAAFWLGRLMS